MRNNSTISISVYLPVDYVNTLDFYLKELPFPITRSRFVAQIIKKYMDIKINENPTLATVFAENKEKKSKPLSKPQTVTLKVMNLLNELDMLNPDKKKISHSHTNDKNPLHDSVTLTLSAS